MAWRQPGDKPLNEPNYGLISWCMYASLGLTKISYILLKFIFLHISLNVLADQSLVKLVTYNYQFIAAFWEVK